MAVDRRGATKLSGLDLRLGEFEFSTGSDQWLRLDDNTNYECCS